MAKNKRNPAMATNSSALSQEDRRALTQIADKSGDKGLRDAVNAYLERSAKGSEPNGSEARLATQAKASDRPTDINLEEDTEFLALCMEELRGLEAELGPETLTIEEAHRILSKVPGSMVEDIHEDRGDR
jgi:hypothetical protein